MRDWIQETWLATERAKKAEDDLAEARALLAQVHEAFSRKVPSEAAEQAALKAVDAFLARQAPEPARESAEEMRKRLGYEPLPWHLQDPFVRSMNPPPEPLACTCPIKPEGSAFWAHVPSCPAAGRGGDR